MELNLSNIQINLQINYYNNLLLACDKSNINKSNIQKLLQNLLYTEKNDIDNNDVDIDVDNITVSEKNDNITLSEKNDYLYLKPWTKLNIIHKIIKIKEFVNSLNINNLQETNNLKDSIINIIKDKILSKKIKINYDSSKAVIISISCLAYNNNKYQII